MSRKGRKPRKGRPRGPGGRRREAGRRKTRTARQTVKKVRRRRATGKQRSAAAGDETATDMVCRVRGDKWREAVLYGRRVRGWDRWQRTGWGHEHRRSTSRLGCGLISIPAAYLLLSPPAPVALRSPVLLSKSSPASSESHVSRLLSPCHPSLSHPCRPVHLQVSS